jgi:gliding motility-associated-like protein
MSQCNLIRIFLPAFLFFTGHPAWTQTLYFTSNETLKLYELNVSNCEVTELADLTFPYYFFSNQKYLSAIVFHPNGKVYAVNSIDLMELNLSTGMLSEVFTYLPRGDSLWFPLWVGMGIDDQNLLNTGWSSLWKYDVTKDSVVFRTRAGHLFIDNFVMYRDLIFSNRREKFQLITCNPEYCGQWDDWTTPGLTEMTAMTIFYGPCDDTIIYGIDYNLEHLSRVYTIDPVAHRLDTLCELNINWITAMSSAEVYQHPFLQPDFDMDNSSGHMGDGYWTTWPCDGTTRLCDDDVSLKLCGPIDSIIVLCDPEDWMIGEDLESGRAGVWSWINDHSYDSNEIKVWLKDLRYSTDDVSKEKTVVTYWYSGKNVAEIWTVIAGRSDPFFQDTTWINLCSTGEVIEIDKLLGLAGEQIEFSPPLPDARFDPLINAGGFYTLKRVAPCPSSTVIYFDIKLPPENWPLDPQVISGTDTIRFESPYPDEVTFIWLDYRKVHRNIFEPGEYPYRITTGGCAWQSRFTVTKNEEGFCKIFVPNAFTPNDDGINDELEIYPEPHCASISSFMVYNRYGERIYQSSSATPKWDGGHRIPGVYFYRLKFTDLITNSQREKTGTITLIK